MNDSMTNKRNHHKKRRWSNVTIIFAMLGFASFPVFVRAELITSLKSSDNCRLFSFRSYEFVGRLFGFELITFLIQQSTILPAYYIAKTYQIKTKIVRQTRFIWMQFCSITPKLRVWKNGCFRSLFNTYLILSAEFKIKLCHLIKILI